VTKAPTYAVDTWSPEKLDRLIAESEQRLQTLPPLSKEMEQHWLTVLKSKRAYAEK
jgi:hypothetical protein